MKLLPLIDVSNRFDIPTISYKISLELTKFSFWQEDYTLGYHSLKFRHFTDNF